MWPKNPGSKNSTFIQFIQHFKIWPLFNIQSRKELHAVRPCTSMKLCTQIIWSLQHPNPDFQPWLPSSGSLYFTAIIRSRASASSLSRSLAARRCSWDSHALAESDRNSILRERERETEIDKTSSKFIKSHGICCRAASSASRLDTELYKRWTPEAHVASKYHHGNVKHV